MRASRCSHSIVSYGCAPASVKYRRIPIPICSGAIAMRLTPPLLGFPVSGLSDHKIWRSRYGRPRHAEDHYTTVITSVSTLSSLVGGPSSQVRRCSEDSAGESAHKVRPRGSAELSRVALGL